MSIGLTLSERFYNVVVAPLLAETMPHLRYAAARLGDGSEVLGFDTGMSADHNYGPTLQIFLSEEDFMTTAGPLMSVLDARLPAEIDGWEVRFPSFGRPGTKQPGMLSSGHGVELYTLESWCLRQLGIDPDTPLGPLDWLALPEQRLLTVTGGALYRDDGGRLTALRDRLAYFPRDVWLYKLAAQWSLIGEEQAFVGRCGENGDDAGSQIIASRLAEAVMRLCFLIERRYAPYAKWFGSAFGLLASAAAIRPSLSEALMTPDWTIRQRALAEACRLAGEAQLRHAVPGAVAPRIHQYYDRPFLVCNAGEIADGVHGEITDSELLALPHVGAVDQLTNSTPVLTHPDLARSIVRAISATDG